MLYYITCHDSFSFDNLIIDFCDRKNLNEVKYVLLQKNVVFRVVVFFLYCLSAALIDLLPQLQYSNRYIKFFVLIYLSRISCEVKKENVSLQFLYVISNMTHCLNKAEKYIN